MAQSRARLFLWGVAPILVARNSPVPQPAAMAVVVGASLSSRGGFAEHRDLRDHHLLRPCPLRALSGSAPTFRDHGARRPDLRRRDHVGARLAGLPDPS